MASASFQTRVVRYIRQIPPGRVATYGQIAGLAGSPRAAIIVGEILRRQTHAHDLPWQRVINRQGRLSIVNIEFPAALQAELLRNEGVAVEEIAGTFQVDLARFQWNRA